MMSVAVSTDRKSLAPQAAVRSAGTTPHSVRNAFSAVVAAAGLQAQLPGEGDEAGDDQADRDDRRPPGRVGVPERDHGPGPVRACGDGLAEAGRTGATGRRTARGVGATSGTGSRTDWLEAVLGDPDERGRRLLDPGHDVQSRAGRPSRRRRRPAGTGPCSSPSALSKATTRAFGRVVGVDPAGPPLGARPRHRHRVHRGRPQERVLRRPRHPSRRSCRRRTGRVSPASVANRSPSM